METPEHYEKRDIRRVLDKYLAWHFMPQMGGFGRNGVPDIIGCYKGRFFAIEVKREGKKLTPLQERQGAAIVANGGAFFWGTAECVIPALKAWLST